MILTCPACSSRYLIDPEALGGGRTVRCANCGHRWFVAPPEDAPPRPEAAVEPPRQPPDGEPSVQPAAPAASAAAHAEDPGRSRRLIGWLVLTLVVLVGVGAVVGRNEVVASFPEAVPVYRQLGLPVTVPLGLEFRGVTPARLEEGDVDVLVVEGEIVNITDQDRAVPRVRVALLDQSRRELEHELFPADAQVLEGGGATRFTARLVNPPEQARNFEVTFAAADDR